MEVTMTGGKAALLSAFLALAVSGCVYESGAAGDNAAANIDNSQQRGISADIDASLNHGPTSAEPGSKGTSDQIGALPPSTDIGGR
jgi:hypothetical protein